MQQMRALAAIMVGLGVLFAAVATGVAGAASKPSAGEPAPSSEAAALVGALDATLNAHDVDRTLAFFMDSATVQDDRRPQTQEQLRGWLGQLVREDLRLDLRGQPTVGPAAARQPSEWVVWPATVSLTRYRRLGIEHVDATVWAVVQHGRFSFLSIRPSSELVPVMAAPA